MIFYAFYSIALLGLLFEEERRTETAPCFRFVRVIGIVVGKWKWSVRTYTVKMWFTKAKRLITNMSIFPPREYLVQIFCIKRLWNNKVLENLVGIFFCFFLALPQKHYFSTMLLHKFSTSYLCYGCDSLKFYSHVKC